jgi:CubicO group peptidase (beta-lactamase class C family)
VTSGAATDQLQDRTDAYLQGRMEADHIPAVAAAIVHEGEIVYCRAHGRANLEWEIPATAETAFQLASAIKPLTGTLLMMLVEAGDLRLEAPVREYLPQAPAAWDEITVRHLATHTAGLSEEAVSHVHTRAAGEDLPPGTANSVPEIVAAAAELPLASRPGEHAQYGLTATVVLTAIIEAVAGRAFPALLHDRLLEPLGMSSTRFDNGADHGGSRIADIVPRRASLFRWHEGQQRDFRFFYPVWSYAAGGLLSSAADLARWTVALDRGELLRPETMEEMFTPQTLLDGTLGLFSPGWVVYTHDERRVVGHSGGPALGDIVRFRDDGFTVVALTNQQALAPDVAPGIADVFLSGRLESE